jgi:predicted Zn-dependent protease with MMP-like domain
MRKTKPKGKTLAQWAEREVAAVRASLPADIRIQAEGIPVGYEPEPDPGLVADGVEPDTLGLFVGSDFVHERDGQGELPPRIFLFLTPLWEEAEGDPECFRAEVRRTYLHELGHYLGWEEEDMKARDLE